VSFRYSQELEDDIAEYATGDRNDRSEKTLLEIYTKLEYARMFFDFCERYVSLSGKRFLELGCGTAFVSVAAAERGATVAATDYVERCLEFAQRRFSEHGIEGTIYQSDLREAIPDGSKASFDFVFCFQVLEHIPRDGQFKALGNLLDMVAPGGFVFIDTENALCPYDRHDTQTWLTRLLSKEYQEDLICALGKGLNFFEPSVGKRVQLHDYLSYDEIIGAAGVRGFRVVDPFMPHGSKRQYLKTVTGSDWLHDNILRYFDVERFAPVSLLLQHAP
jgi:2-polyprenyl-3-methyl-5-hydroxy-6-metoxy-1,4-benzoquinol methylase